MVEFTQSAHVAKSGTALSLTCTVVLKRPPFTHFIGVIVHALPPPQNVEANTV